MRTAGLHRAVLQDEGAIMFDTHRKALGTGLATALILAAAASPAALARPTDLRSPAALARPTDLRSPDARDAAQPAHVVVAGLPMRAANERQVARSRAVASAPSSGLDWGSAGIGAVAGLGAFAIALAGVGVLRRRVARPAAEL
jgi:hypothetical protein